MVLLNWVFPCIWNLLAKHQITIQLNALKSEHTVSNRLLLEEEIRISLTSTHTSMLVHSCSNLTQGYIVYYNVQYIEFSSCQPNNEAIFYFTHSCCVHISTSTCVNQVNNLTTTIRCLLQSRGEEIYCDVVVKQEYTRSC